MNPVRNRAIPIGSEKRATHESRCLDLRSASFHTRRRTAPPSVSEKLQTSDLIGDLLSPISRRAERPLRDKCRLPARSRNKGRDKPSRAFSGPGPGQLIRQAERKSRRVAPVHRAQRRPVHANARESGRTGDCQCFRRRPEIFINYRPRRDGKNSSAEENTRETTRSRGERDARALPSSAYRKSKRARARK